MKFGVVLVSILLSLPAYAGFGTGFVAGAVVGSAATSGSSATGNSLYASDKEGRDVVVCCTSHRSDFAMCEDVQGTGRPVEVLGPDVNLTPIDFIRHIGYTRLYTRAFLRPTAGCPMIIMEVGK